MRARVFWLTLLRFLLLLLSLATLACHVVQIVFLKQYSDANGIGSWFPEQVPYILYFVGPAVSSVCAMALNFVSISSVKAIRGDRSMSVLNIALLVAVIVYNTLKSGVIPWTDGKAKGGPSQANLGFASYCSSYQDTTTQYRCWLTDGTWLGCIVIAGFWLILAFYVFAQSTSDIYDDDYDMYDFKDDVPMAVTTTRTQEAETYHASSPATPNYYNNNNIQSSHAAGYQEYYPPQSPYAGYEQPVAAGGYHQSAGYNYGGAYPTTGTVRPEDTVHMMSDIGGDPHQQQYYSPHLNHPPPPPPSFSTSVQVQNPNAY